MPPPQSKDHGEYDDVYPSVDDPSRRDVTRLVDAATIPARVAIVAGTAEALLDDLELLASSNQPPPEAVVGAARSLVAMARDVKATMLTLSEHPRPVRPSDAVYAAGLLRDACEDFQFRIATLTMDGDSPHVADAVIAAGLARQAELLHRLLISRRPAGT